MKQYLLYILLFFSLVVQAQTQQDTTNLKRIDASSDHAWIERTDTSTTQYLIGNVKIYHDSTYMFCDSAIIQNQRLKAIGNIIIIQNDSLQIFADTMYYDGDSLKSELINNVVLEQGGNKMFSNHLYYNMDTKIATYNDTASFFLKRTKLISVKGRYDANISLASFYEKVNMVDSVFNLRTDTLDFYTTLEKMVFRAPTRIDQKTKKIYCEAGYYDIKNGMSEFRENAQYEDGETIASAQQILYNSKEDEIQLIGEAKYKDKTQKANADRIVRKEKEQTFDLFGNAFYQNENKKITGDTIHYNEQNKNMITFGRSVIDDEKTHLEANHIDFEESSGNGIAKGNVIYIDKKESRTVYCENMIISENNTKIKIFSNDKKPMLESILDQDTMFLTADTLFTYVYTDTLGEEYKKIRAFNDVKIFKSDLQAVGDSLYFDTKTERISLFDNPIMWSDTSQFTGKIIHLNLKKNKISQVILQSKAFIIQSQDELYFNQISGKEIIISFNDSTISSMKVNGNAESIYYMLDDDKKYIGVSKTICSDIQFNFKNGTISKSKFYPQPNTETLPMKTTNHDQLKLKGFEWQKERRPLSVDDILILHPKSK